VRGGFLAALIPANTTTSLCVRNDKTLTTDGSSAETKEQLDGYYMLNCKNLDDAIEFAARIPSATPGPIEIQPITEFD
jgi:hypothetical protein